MHIKNQNLAKSLFILDESPWMYWMPKFIDQIEDSKVFYATYDFKKHTCCHSFPFDSTPESIVGWIIENRFEKVVLITNQAGLQRDSQIGKALVNKKIPVVFQDKTVAHIGLSKIRQKELLKTNGFPIPESALAENMSQAFEIAKKIGFPLMCKVAELSDGRKMKLVREEQEIEEYFYENAINEPVILEKYIEGKEISTIVYHNFGYPLVFPLISKPMTSYLYNSGQVRKRVYYSPEKKLEKIKKQVQDIALQISKKIGNTYLMGLDIVLDKNNRANIIEINTREVETLRMSMMLTGINIYKLMHSMRPLEVNTHLESKGYVIDVPISEENQKLIDKLKRSGEQEMIVTTNRATFFGKDLNALFKLAEEFVPY